MNVRLPSNKNLTLVSDTCYRGNQVIHTRGPLIVEYLDRAIDVIDFALSQYRRIFAFRVDLRLPDATSSGTYPAHYEENTMERFFTSFRYQILKQHREKGADRYFHQTKVRYIWAREQRGRKPHYHVMMVLNGNAFCALGKFELDRNNLYNKLVVAWARTLRIAVEDAQTLVHIPKKQYRVHETDAAGLSELLYRLSYLCKAETKQYGHGKRSFGTSREGHSRLVTVHRRGLLV